MTIAVDWDVKQQNKQNFAMKMVVVLPDLDLQCFQNRFRFSRTMLMPQSEGCSCYSEFMWQFQDLVKSV